MNGAHLTLKIRFTIALVYKLNQFLASLVILQCHMLLEGIIELFYSLYTKVSGLFLFSDDALNCSKVTVKTFIM